jgi:cytochrome P450
MHINHIIFVLAGPNWRHHRHLIQPNFHFSILEGFIGTFYDSAQLLVAKLSNEADLSSVNITAPINQCVLNILQGEEPACVLLVIKYLSY